MNGRNLIPLARRRRRAFHRATVRWAVAVPALVASVVVVGTVLSAVLPTGTADAAEADRTANQASAARVTASALRVQVAVARHALEAAHEVSDQPDWSLLLADLARRMGDDGVLSACELVPAEDGAGKGLVLKLTGVARSQAAATQLALRLEAAGVFDRVDLQRTSPTQLGGADAVSFQMACTVVGGRGRLP
jgi:hypothetical protein